MSITGWLAALLTSASELVLALTSAQQQLPVGLAANLAK